MKIDVLASVFDPPPTRVEVDPAKLDLMLKHLALVYGSHFTAAPSTKPALTATRAMTPEEAKERREFIDAHLSF